MRIKVVLIIILMSYVAEGDAGAGGALEGKVVGGSNSSITEFPHAVFLRIQCHTLYSLIFGIPFSNACGGSVLNQRIVLTAAHCFEECRPPPRVVAYTGSAVPREEEATMAAASVVHPLYDPHSVSNDIALVALNRDLRLRESVARVSISPTPPQYTQLATVSGWGLIDVRHIVKLYYRLTYIMEEINNIGTDRLQHLKYMRLMSRRECARKLRKALPPRTLCAGDLNQNQYVSIGDSGGALMVGAAQIGVVSHKLAASRSLVIYTDVSSFFTWIQDSANAMHCLEKEREDEERKESMIKAKMERKAREQRQIREELKKIQKEIKRRERSTKKKNSQKRIKKTKIYGI
ncbi:mast cell protease 1A [Plutella xylostella]|uniref:mast cell protease 1A n=1 Tax=Plutella xylostella TaxID=51655 RepID=UPI002032401D|nr:mast cell protease 1A [Plutella xylostella]